MNITKANHTPAVIALVGNPNSGKTSLFNWLTGSNQKVGNYPGVSMEKVEGNYEYDGQSFHLVDLPGIYSMSAYFENELVSRNFLMNQSPSVVVDVIDSSNLERNLYLTTQFLEMGLNLVVVLNMADELKKSGREIDLDIFSKRLQVPVVLTTGTKGEGIENLKKVIANAAKKPSIPRKIFYHPEIEEGIQRLEETLSSIKGFGLYKSRYLAIKLLEGDESIIGLLKALPDSEPVFEILKDISNHLKSVLGDLPDVIISDGRYGFAAGLVRECTTKFPPIDRISLSEKLDSILTHRVFALPIFFFLMYMLFWLVFKLGELPMQGIEIVFHWLGNAISLVIPSHTFWNSLLIDGIIGGVGGVIVFLPNILLLFMGITMLEDSGYMARVAFIMDRLMHQMGLHGKSFIPMMVGFGCTVPGILASRILENPKDRLTTMMVLPLISCGARFPIYTLIIPAFFPPWLHPIALFGVYLFGIGLAVVLARLLRTTVFKGEEMPFVMELPPYRLPTLNGLLHHTWERGWLYLKKAGTVILGVSILMWFASYYPRKPFYEVDQLVAKGEKISQEQQAKLRISEQLQYSILGRVGKAVEPLFKPMGFDWRIATALLGALTAKEVFVAQISIIFSLDSESSSESLRDKLRKNYSILTGICLLIFCLIATPCMATVAVTNKESGSWSWAMLQFWGLTFIAYVLTAIVYQTGTLLWP